MRRGRANTSADARVAYARRLAGGRVEVARPLSRASKDRAVFRITQYSAPHRDPPRCCPLERAAAAEFSDQRLAADLRRGSRRPATIGSFQPPDRADRRGLPPSRYWPARSCRELGLPGSSLPSECADLVRSWRRSGAVAGATWVSGCEAPSRPAVATIDRRGFRVQASPQHRWSPLAACAQPGLIVDRSVAVRSPPAADLPPGNSCCGRAGLGWRSGGVR